MEFFVLFQLLQLERDMLVKQMGIAKLRVAMNEAKEELGKAVAGQDFIRPPLTGLRSMWLSPRRS